MLFTPLACRPLARLCALCLACVMAVRIAPLQAQTEPLSRSMDIEQSTPAMSFERAFEVAREQDLRHRAAVTKLQAQMQDFEVAQSRLRPKVTLSAARSKVDLFRQDALGITASQNYPSNSDVLSLRQPIYAPSLTADEAQQEQLYRSYQQSVFQEQMSLFFRLVDQALEHWALNQERDLLLDQIDKLKQRMAGVNQRFTSGVGTKTEVSEVQLDLERLQAQLTGVLAREVSARLDLRLMFGSTVDFSGLRLAERSFFGRLKLPRPELTPSVLLDSYPEVQARRLEYEASKWALQSISSRHKPTLDFAGQSARALGESAYYTESRTRTQTLGIQLNWSLYEGGGILAAEKQAVINTEQARLRFEEAQLRALADYQRFYWQYVSALDKVSAFERTLEAAREANQANLRSYQTGFRSMIDVLLTEGRVLQVSSDLMRARVEALQAWLRANAMLQRNAESLTELLKIKNE